MPPQLVRFLRLQLELPTVQRHRQVPTRDRLVQRLQGLLGQLELRPRRREQLELLELRCPKKRRCSNHQMPVRQMPVRRQLVPVQPALQGLQHHPRDLDWRLV